MDNQSIRNYSTYTITGSDINGVDMEKITVDLDEPRSVQIRKNRRYKYTHIREVVFTGKPGVLAHSVVELKTTHISTFIDYRYKDCRCGDCPPFGMYRTRNVQILVPTNIKRQMDGCIESSMRIQDSDNDDNMWVDLYIYNHDKRRLDIPHDPLKSHLARTGHVLLDFFLFMREDFNTNTYHVGAGCSEEAFQLEN